MPRVLSTAEITDFRERLCAVAERLFAERGAEGVTLRQVAAELGVSAMTPYRYFKDKDEILAAVRTSAFERFASAMEAAYSGTTGDARVKSQAVAATYMQFATQSPQAYRLMVDIAQPNEADYPDLVAAVERSRATMTAYVQGLVDEGVLAGDPYQIGLAFWAAMHGVMSLRLAGKLPEADEAAVRGLIFHALGKGLRPS